MNISLFHSYCLPMFVILRKKNPTIYFITINAKIALKCEMTKFNLSVT